MTQILSKEDITKIAVRWSNSAFAESGDRFIQDFGREIQIAMLKKLKAIEPVAWFKHGPYSDDEPMECVFDNPGDEDNFSPLIFQDVELNRGLDE